MLPVPGCVHHLAARKCWFLVWFLIYRALPALGPAAWHPLAHGSGLSAGFAAALPVLVNF